MKKVEPTSASNSFKYTHALTSEGVHLHAKMNAEISKIVLKIEDFQNGVEYERSFTEENVGKEINRKVDLSDIYYVIKSATMPPKYKLGEKIKTSSNEWNLSIFSTGILIINRQLKNLNNETVQYKSELKLNRTKAIILPSSSSGNVSAGLNERVVKIESDLKQNDERWETFVNEMIKMKEYYDGGFRSLRTELQAQIKKMEVHMKGNRSISSGEKGTAIGKDYDMEIMSLKKSVQDLGMKQSQEKLGILQIIRDQNKIISEKQKQIEKLAHSVAEIKIQMPRIAFNMDEAGKGVRRQESSEILLKKMQLEREEKMIKEKLNKIADAFISPENKIPTRPSPLKKQTYSPFYILDCQGHKYFKFSDRNLITYTGESLIKTQLLGTFTVTEKSSHNFIIIDDCSKPFGIGLINPEYASDRYSHLNTADKQDNICFFNDGNLRGIERGQVNTGKGYTKGDNIVMNVNVEGGKIQWLINGRSAAAYQSKRVRMQKVRWVPYVYCCFTGQKFVWNNV